MKQQTLHIDPEFKAQIPPLTEDERKQLEENILADGEILSPHPCLERHHCGRTQPV